MIVAMAERPCSGAFLIELRHMMLYRATETTTLVCRSYQFLWVAAKALAVHAPPSGDGVSWGWRHIENNPDSSYLWNTSSHDLAKEAIHARKFGSRVGTLAGPIDGFD
jgi:hypothetical protein